MRGLPVAFLLAAACTGGGDAREPVDDPAVPVISVATELAAAEHQVVRVRGPVFHEKLGDGVMVDGVDVLCPDLRITGDADVTLQGRLELWDPPVAEVDDSGAISQGVTEPTSRWVLRDCKQV